MDVDRDVSALTHTHTHMLSCPLVLAIFFVFISIRNCRNLGTLLLSFPSLLPSSNHHLSLALTLSLSLTHSSALYLCSHYSHCVCVSYLSNALLCRRQREHTTQAIERVSEQAVYQLTRSLAFAACTPSLFLSLSHTCALIPSRLHCQSHARPSVGFDQCCRAPAEQQRRRRRRRATHFAVSHCAEWVRSESVGKWRGG